MTVRALHIDDPLTKSVIGEAMYVHRVLGPGFIESVYPSAQLLRLKKLGLNVEREMSLPVHFDGEIIGVFVADLVVENRLILELKAVSALNSVHEAQLVHYLTATKIDTGLLLNFEATSLEIKRKTRTLPHQSPAEEIRLTAP